VGYPTLWRVGGGSPVPPPRRTRNRGHARSRDRGNKGTRECDPRRLVAQVPAVMLPCSLSFPVLTLISEPCTRKVGVCPRTFRVSGKVSGLDGGSCRAGVAQLVEHLICNQRVGGSNPFASSRKGSRKGTRETAKVHRRAKIVDRRGLNSAVNPLQVHAAQVRRQSGRSRRGRMGIEARGFESARMGSHPSRKNPPRRTARVGQPAWADGDESWFPRSLRRGGRGTGGTQDGWVRRFGHRWPSG
jgi:hypothetical protein